MKKQKDSSAEKKTLVMKLAGEMNQMQQNYASSPIASLVDLQLMKTHTQTDLHQAIFELVKAGGGANIRSRTDALNSCKALDNFRTGLLKGGYILSRQALYFRLMLRGMYFEEEYVSVRLTLIDFTFCKGH